MSLAPDLSKARHAGSKLQKLFDTTPAINSSGSPGMIPDEYHGRSDVAVVRGLNLSIRAGQYVAIVGPSGCGKSTLFGLLERFYDVRAGTIRVNGFDITTLNVDWLRRRVALVSQEPTLLQGTIRENTLFGISYVSLEGSNKAVLQAFRAANIYDFILSLSQQLETRVWSEGMALSGGQRQRISIAQALLRDPEILLLDEATSVLDSTSESLIQTALDRLAKGGTIIFIAHRLSTIRNADVILVIDSGHIVETGTQEELLAAKGRYAQSVMMQSFDEG